MLLRSLLLVAFARKIVAVWAQVMMGMSFWKGVRDRDAGGKAFVGRDGQSRAAQLLQNGRSSYKQPETSTNSHAEGQICMPCMGSLQYLYPSHFVMSLL